MAKIVIVMHQYAQIITELWPFTHVTSSKFASTQYFYNELVKFDNILQMLTCNHKQDLGLDHIQWICAYC